MSNEISLNETELLLLQQQMEGDIQGLNYALEVAGADSASFTGDDSGNIHEVPPVEEADEVGEIDTIKFRVHYQGKSQEPERNPLLSIHDDGKMNCQTPVLPPLFDRVVSQIDLIKQHDGYLDPVNQLTREFIEDKYAARPTRDIDAYILDTRTAFNELVQHYFDTTHLAPGTIRAYESIIANIGIGVCKAGIPEADSLGLAAAGTGSFPIEEEHNDQLQDFFTEYAHRILEEDIEFEDLVPHLIEILPWTRPLNQIEETIDLYALE
ncbi:MAG: hypothetical protein ABEI86_12875 [Halobacteriaceae archaeon]